MIYKLRDLLGVDDLGGTMRLGSYPCNLEANTRAYSAYGRQEIAERHRHRYEFNRGKFAPYPLAIDRPAPRVTDEKSRVTIRDSTSVVFQVPNRIRLSDFEGWVQERGLYFPSEWDQRYQALLEMADPGESPLHGSLLIAPHGKGIYVHTSLSFFRQLPAGVPGAYRLFANLISLDSSRWQKSSSSGSRE